MKIIVPMKQIPDLQQIRIRNRKPAMDDVPTTFGAIDKNALEAAVQLKEAGDDIEVIALCLGDEDVEDTVKEATAAGADRSILIEDDDAYGIESADVAAILAAAIKEEGADLVIFGEGSGDNYSGQVGPRVAQILGMPQVGYACDIELGDGTATVTRALEDNLEVCEVALPAAVIVAADLNTARTPSVMQVLKAGKKPKDIKELDDFDDIDVDDPSIEIVSNLAPEVNRKNIEVKSVADLVAQLKAERII